MLALEECNERCEVDNPSLQTLGKEFACRMCGIGAASLSAQQLLVGVMRGWGTCAVEYT